MLGKSSAFSFIDRDNRLVVKIYRVKLDGVREAEALVIILKILYFFCLLMQGNK